MPAGLREKRHAPPLTATLPPPKLFKIGEVMRYSGLSRQTVHNYTVMGLITEQERTESGHRLYGEEVFARLRRLEELKGHMTLLEIRELFESEGPGR
jgi:DNA-binding transcriptional MerR regulator